MAEGLVQTEREETDNEAQLSEQDSQRQRWTQNRVETNSEGEMVHRENTLLLLSADVCGKTAIGENVKLGCRARCCVTQIHEAWHFWFIPKFSMCSRGRAMSNLDTTMLQANK